MNRRNFFQTIAAALTATVAAPLLPAKVLAMPAMPAPDTQYLIVSVGDVILSSMRLLGVLLPGEMASSNDLEAARFALYTLADHFPEVVRPWCEWRAALISSSDMFEDRWVMPASRVRVLRWALACELAPEYGMEQFWVPSCPVRRTSSGSDTARTISRA
jgi:hypothetical protein